MRAVPPEKHSTNTVTAHPADSRAAACPQLSNFSFTVMQHKEGPFRVIACRCNSQAPPLSNQQGNVPALKAVLAQHMTAASSSTHTLTRIRAHKSSSRDNPSAAHSMCNCPQGIGLIHVCVCQGQAKGLSTQLQVPPPSHTAAQMQALLQQSNTPLHAQHTPPPGQHPIPNVGGGSLWNHHQLYLRTSPPLHRECVLLQVRRHLTTTAAAPRSCASWSCCWQSTSRRCCAQTPPPAARAGCAASG